MHIGIVIRKEKVAEKYLKGNGQKILKFEEKQLQSSRNFQER